MIIEKISLRDKKRKLKKLRSLLNTAWNISNDLISEEKHSHTNNENNLYDLREDIGSCQTRVDFIEYKD